MRNFALLTSPTLKTVSLLSVVGLSLLAGCSEPEVDETESLDPRVLHEFESCDDMIEFASAHSLELAESDGWWGGGFDNALDGAAEDEAGGGGGGPSHSTTNVQEAGVDEPDLVKTDGNKILAVAQNRLHFVDVSAMVPELRGSIDLPQGSWDPQLFMNGDRVLVLMRSDNYEADLTDAPEVWLQDDYTYVPLTRIVEVDISNPDELTIVRTQTIGGNLVAARMVDDTVRVVIRSHVVGLDLRTPWDFMYGDGGGRHSVPGDPGEPIPADGDEEGFRMGGSGSLYLARVKARQHNSRQLEDAGPENFIPQVVTTDESGSSQEQLFGCEQVMRPGDPSGMDMLSVVTIDIGSDLQIGDGVGIFSSGEMVYASQESLYVATRPWQSWFGGGGGDDIAVVEGLAEGDEEGFEFRDQAASEDSGIRSYIHKFDISDPRVADYTVSGEVRGWLMSQWSMSEQDGVLRVASTDHFDGLEESYVSTFEDDGDQLLQLGQVGGLGEGEQIYAVRFMGDIGYVVTFRQIDPLYTVDLGDPTAPVVRGELKIEGYSSYLHPIGDDHLIGIGQDATEEGQTLGTQLSIFDVSDLDDPQRVHQYTLGEGWSEAEYDHHAFLYWEPQDLVVVPIEAWGEFEEDWFRGAMALRVDVDSGIEHLANIQHGSADQWEGLPRRSVVVEDRLYTVSELGILGNGIDDFAEIGWAEF